MPQAALAIAADAAVDIAVEACVATAKTSRPRKDVVPPASIPAGMTLFDYLSRCQPPLDQKIIDIACSQNQVPPELKKEAAQEIRLMWFTLKPDTERFKPGQIAAYAHRMAGHSALRLRRELGSSVRLPGSAFRKRKDGSSYVTPGVLAAALEWDKLEGWFQTDGGEAGEGGGGGAPQGMADELGVNPLMTADGEPVLEEDEDQATRDERQELLERHRDDLTPRQFAIMGGLVAGATFEDVMKEHGIKNGVLMREVAIISSIVGVLP